MINATNKYKEYVSKKSRTFIPRLVIENQEYKRILNFEYEDGLESGNEMSLGSTISKSLKFSIPAIEGTFNNKQVTVYIGLKTDTGIEEIKKATLTVMKATRKDGLLNFECYDQFYFCEKVFVTDLTGTQKVKTIVDEQCNKLGVTFNGTIEDTSYNVDLLKGLTIREALSYLSAWCGKNAHFNAEGQLEFIGYNSVYEITASKYSSFDFAELDTTINSLTCITKESVTDEDGNTSQEDKELTCGEGYGISFSCLGMTQERLNVIYNRLKGFEYRSATVSLNLSDPTIEPGDIIKIDDYFIPVMNITSSCDGGFKSEITAYAKTEQEQEFEFKGSLANQVERNYKEEASFRKLITENIKAFKGQFDEIDVDVININKTLSAQEASIKKLDSEKLSAQEATIKYAQITDLKAVSGKFDTLESDYGKFKDLTSTNITGINANIKKINAENVNIANRITANEGLIKNLDTVKLNAADAYLAFAKIADLNAANANISSLDANVANINSVLAGNVGSGLLQTIHLTAENMVIDDAVIKSANIEGLDVSKLKAGTISTDKFTIQSNDGGVVISGSTQQFTDKNGKVRLQIGKDAKGDFNFIVFGEDGTTAIYNQNGITKEAVPDGLIVDGMVADNANIQASKVKYVDKDGNKTLQTVIEQSQGKMTELIRETEIIRDDASSALDKATDVENRVNSGELDGEDSILLYIDSSNGTTFKNSDIATIFTVSIYVGGEVIDTSQKLRDKYSSSAYLQWLIKRYGETEYTKIPLDDPRINDNGFIFTLSAKDIKFKAVFNCELNI